MRLNNYLNEDRSKSLTMTQALDFLNEKCSTALRESDKNNCIYRGVNSNYDAIVIDPKNVKKKRISANTTNYYTLLMDNSSSWKQYPKRSESIICSTDICNADSYGILYEIFPLDGAKIGVCSDEDVWDSFKNLSLSMDFFNTYLTSILNIKNVHGRLEYPKGNMNNFDSSFSVLKSACKEFDTNVGVVSDWREQIKYMVDSYTSKNIMKILKSYKGNLLNTLNTKLSPAKNGFKLAKIGDTLPKNREAWTDSVSIGIKQ